MWSGCDGSWGRRQPRETGTQRGAKQNGETREDVRSAGNRSSSLVFPCVSSQMEVAWEGGVCLGPLGIHVFLPPVLFELWEGCWALVAGVKARGGTRAFFFFFLESSSGFSFSFSGLGVGKGGGGVLIPTFVHYWFSELLFCFRSLENWWNFGGVRIHVLVGVFVSSAMRLGWVGSVWVLYIYGLELSLGCC